VLVGALFGLGGVWLQNRTAERSAYRQELRVHYAAFMSGWEVLQRARDAKYHALHAKEQIDAWPSPEVITDIKDLEASIANIEALPDDEKTKAKRHLRSKMDVNDELIAANETLIDAGRRLSTMANEFVLIAPLHIGNAAWTLISERSEPHDTNLVMFITIAVRAEIGRTAKDRAIWSRMVKESKRENWYMEMMTSRALRTKDPQPSD